MTLNHVRIGYLALQLFKVAIYYYVSRIIQRKNDRTVLEYVEPVSSSENEKENELVTTVYDHDMTETSYLLRSVLLVTATVIVTHIYTDVTRPYLSSALIDLKNVYDAKPVAIHLRGKPAIGELKRPFYHKNTSWLGRIFDWANVELRTADEQILDVQIAIRALDLHSGAPTMNPVI
ncbi:hypothetical protein GALMADRAFT_282225 [Galerina marginata CBS 339.88]|uniref:Uncharacterized protein n=1 Tax=Galerina marginata (strain CBS 339.88) TaxID=685588 RepID=A0A067SS56_GALM3|nr:hypothetical protein GALMADRAFT_282225 [Galerina marginata CBS 339.88]